MLGLESQQLHACESSLLCRYSDTRVSVCTEADPEIMSCSLSSIGNLAWESFSCTQGIDDGDAVCPGPNAAVSVSVKATSK
mmetsp:Transcript_111728/g.216435  ORF Transcript_111728/g.216435 Transcript_111728/m.216435 type:complete len:81 (-) Transcript_111728:28-270(-)